MQTVSPPTFSQAAAQVRAHNASKVGVLCSSAWIAERELQARSVGRNLSLVPYVSGVINGQPEQTA